MKHSPQLRVVVNSRCGRACFFCRPSGESISTAANISMDYEVLVRISKAFYKNGITSIKITGGDPALWEDLVKYVDVLKNEIGFQEIEVISRHPRIGILAPALAEAGASIINISLDTLDPELHKLITGIDDLSELESAIKQCVKSEVACKINMVVMKGVNDDEVNKIIQFCETTGVRTLKLLDTIKDLDYGTESYIKRLKHINRFKNKKLSDLYIPLEIISSRLKPRAVNMSTITQGSLGHPMLSLYFASGLQILIKDHQAGAWYGPMCDGCKHFPCHDALMAIRLTPDFRLQFCLLREDNVVSLKPVLEESDAVLTELIKESLSLYDKAEFIRTSNLDNVKIAI